MAETVAPAPARESPAPASTPSATTESSAPSTATAVGLLGRGNIANRAGHLAVLQRFAGNAAVTAALQRTCACRGSCACGGEPREQADPAAPTPVGVAQRTALQRNKDNEKPLGEIQGLPMYALLPALATLEPAAARTDREAGGFVGGPRLVVAMNAVAMKGDWKGFAAANAGELGGLPIDQIGDVMRFVGAPADVKTYERDQFEGRFDAFIEPTSGLISLIFKTRIALQEDDLPTPDEVTKFKSEFKQIVESTWSGKGTVQPACPGLKVQPFRTKVTVLYVDGGEHMPIMLNSGKHRAGEVSEDRRTKERQMRLDADGAHLSPNPTQQYAGNRQKDAKGNPIPLESKQAPAAHEFGHAVGVHHSHCDGNSMICYGDTPEEHGDVMGGGMKVQVIKDKVTGKVLHDDFTPFEKIGERWGKDVFPGALQAKCNKWSAS